MTSVDLPNEPSVHTGADLANIDDVSEDLIQQIEDVDPVVLSVILAALKEHPLVDGLSESVLIELGCRAIKLGTTSNQKWLEQEVGRIRAEGAMATRVGAIGDSDTPVAVMEEEAPKKVMTEIKISPPAKITSREELEPILTAHLDWINQVVTPEKSIEGGRANLSGADLSGFDMQGVDLRGANLKRANFTGANLYKANFSTANMEEANLTGANLGHAKLKRTNLAGTDLSGANLQGADLRSCELRGAKYDEEQLAQTQR